MNKTYPRVPSHFAIEITGANGERTWHSIRSNPCEAKEAFSFAQRNHTITPD